MFTFLLAGAPAVGKTTHFERTAYHKEVKEYKPTEVKQNREFTRRTSIGTLTYKLIDGVTTPEELTAFCFNRIIDGVILFLDSTKNDHEISLEVLKWLEHGLVAPTVICLNKDDLVDDDDYTHQLLFLRQLKLQFFSTTGCDPVSLDKPILSLLSEKLKVPVMYI